MGEPESSRAGCLGKAPRTGEQGERDRGNKEDLRDGGVEGGDERRMAELYAGGAEESLRDDQSEGGPPEAANGGALFGAGEPDGEDYRENCYDRGHDTMSEFVANAAYQRRDNLAVGKRPIGDGIGGVVAGHERAGHQEEDGEGGCGDGKAVDAGLVWRNHLRSNSLPCVHVGAAVLAINRNVRGV